MEEEPSGGLRSGRRDVRRRRTAVKVRRVVVGLDGPIGCLTWSVGHQRRTIVVTSRPSVHRLLTVLTSGIWPTRRFTASTRSSCVRSAPPIDRDLIRALNVAPLTDALLVLRTNRAATKQWASRRDRGRRRERRCCQRRRNANATVLSCRRKEETQRRGTDASAAAEATAVFRKHQRPLSANVGATSIPWP